MIVKYDHGYFYVLEKIMRSALEMRSVLAH